MQNFFELSLESLQELLLKNGFEKYRAKQIFEAIYKNKIFTPQQIPTINAKLKDFLTENLTFCEGKLVGNKFSNDETHKYLFELPDGCFVESVMLKAPTDDGKIRKTLCMSTQVGCASGCKFCASAMHGFVRNLSVGEILAQALAFVGENPNKTTRNRHFEFENIVVMGMGEPLANFDYLITSLNIFYSQDKFAFGARRITVSTCGIADKIRKLAEIKFPFRLAISLHGATDEVRTQIMPINKKYPLSEVISAAKEFSSVCGRMITLEYILIADVNDLFQQANKLAEIAKNLHAHVNLIPYNTVEALPWKRSGASRRKAFADILERANVSFTLRREKGTEIDAACGQLALKQKKL